jgi:hypothetical protein
MWGLGTRKNAITLSFWKFSMPQQGGENLNNANMKNKKKKIDMKTAVLILEKLERTSKDDNIVSMRKFIAVNCDVLTRLVRYSGKNIRNIYEDLKASGLDVGTYNGFRSSCYRAGLRRWPKKHGTKFQDPSKIIKNLERPQAPEKARIAASKSNERGPGVSKYNPALPPVMLPGGIEAIIDPESGAKRFEI